MNDNTTMSALFNELGGKMFRVVQFWKNQVAKRDKKIASLTKQNELLKQQLEETTIELRRKRREARRWKNKIPLSPAEYNQYFGRQVQNDYWNYLDVWYKAKFGKRPTPDAQKLSSLFKPTDHV